MKIVFDKTDLVRAGLAQRRTEHKVRIMTMVADLDDADLLASRRTKQQTVATLRDWVKAGAADYAEALAAIELELAILDAEIARRNLTP